jgi:hypothetical protein
MEKKTEEMPKAGTLRWHWEKVGKAKSKEEVQAILAETAALIGDDDITLILPVPTKVYLKVMGDAYLAYRYGEIEKPGTKELLDRALAVYSTVYLRLRNTVEKRKNVLLKAFTGI